MTLIPSISLKRVQSKGEECLMYFLFIFFIAANERAFQAWASAGSEVILLGLRIQIDPTWKESAITQPYSRSIGRHHQ